MTGMLVVAVVLGAAAVAALVVARSNHRTARRIDAVTVSLQGHSGLSSASPDEALARLSRAVLGFTGTERAEDIEVGRYEAALASMTQGVIVVDPASEILYRNPFAAGFLEGRHGEAVVGQTIDDLIEAANAGLASEREVQIYGPPRRKLYVSATPISHGDEALGAVVLIDDITEQERLDAIRRDFVANISHELRTPIGAVSLLAETLVDERDPAVIASLAGRLSSEAQRLADTVDDLLQLSRIEHGSDDDFEPVRLQSAIAAANDRVNAAAEQHGVEIGVTAPERALMVRGDVLQLTSAIYNLLDNGVKYIGADGGVIAVRARSVDDQIEVVVQDSGIGIPRKDLDRVFERFYRVDRGRSRASGGTGLGLAIVRHVVANHGGRISVDSTEGEGTSFTILLPALRTAHDASDDPGETPELPSDDGNGDHEVSTP